MPFAFFEIPKASSTTSMVRQATFILLELKIAITNVCFSHSFIFFLLKM